MIFKSCCYFILFTFSTSCFSQKSGIDTIPFSLSKKLLVFKESINGVAVDFAFDTGAGMGVANSAIQKHVTFDVKNSKKSITDANMQTVKLQNISIKKYALAALN